MKIQYKRLEDLCIKVTDGSHGTPKFADPGYPFITVKNVSSVINFGNCNHISESDYVKLERNCNPVKGDVLFSKDGTVGKVVEVNFSAKFIVLSSLAIIRPDPQKLDSKYLKYYLKSENCLREAFSMKTGSAIRRIIVKDIKNLKIPVFPIFTQKQIGLILEKADNLVQKRKEANYFTDRVVQAIFLQMFGDLYNNKNNFELRKLDDVKQQGTLITYGIVQAGPHVEDGVPYIKTGDIQNGFIRKDNLSKTRQKNS